MTPPPYVTMEMVAAAAILFGQSRDLIPPFNSLGSPALINVLQSHNVDAQSSMKRFVSRWHLKEKSSP